MRHAPEALLAFAEAALLGSFTAAARKLGKRQSTISEAIANLEIDLGVQLFDRSTRTPTLTDAGRALLPQVQRALDAGAAIDRAAARFARGEEARLTFVVSDTYQSQRYEQTLTALAQRFPALELECQIAEHEDVLDLIRQGRAQIGLMAARAAYPADIGAATIAEESEIGLFVGRTHPLAACGDAEVPHAALRDARELRLNTYATPEGQGPGGENSPLVAGTQRWSAPSYLMLLEMAVLGFGWTELPRWMVEHFARDRLCELRARGWPRRVRVDAVWSRNRPLGPAGAWLLDAMLAD
ncbi:LysR family transcriptional regulator [Burkholderia stagnalis]|uniref:LysR family transcriptional regulator n=1 Tax=Burkholderia stagnalis TaxID=1503054 RepID=UPI0007535377|nr:LysR family transcriptional regulator [Burkholderia stagnalis]KVL89548.1 transcriptional regulator [Burkholderia stagnalis]KVL98025.1 transcriptional regulator [Burkholderia stagnalis]KVM15811.1 transcriptional regulator [Burkholderia stagnalis]KVN51878.1 transcriptional regulator [Burkholderia stagnalis]RQQ47854.1 LysR family transcriptional regulator [Burkholderia stagnalis]